MKQFKNQVVTGTTEIVTLNFIGLFLKFKEEIATPCVLQKGLCVFERIFKVLLFESTASYRNIKLNVQPLTFSVNKLYSMYLALCKVGNYKNICLFEKGE